MGILFYQIAIFIAIQASAFYSKKSRNTAIILISIFTLLQVYSSALMILQFLTIFISYLISNKLLSQDSYFYEEKNFNYNNVDNSNNYEPFEIANDDFELEVAKQKQKLLQDIEESFEKKEYHNTIFLIEKTEFNTFRTSISPINDKKREIFNLYIKYFLAKNLIQKNYTLEEYKKSYFYQSNKFVVSKYNVLLKNFDVSQNSDDFPIEILNYNEFGIFFKNLSLVIQEDFNYLELILDLDNYLEKANLNYVKDLNLPLKDFIS